MVNVFHSYHMVEKSPWPLMVSGIALSLVIGMVKMFLFMEYNVLMISFLLLLLISYMWWRDVVRESTFQGYHSSMVVSGLMLGMILFIVSEVFFFISFFWAFFHSSLSPTIELGVMWPPTGVYPFNPFQIPLLNTVILLSSGVSITWCHQSILSENWESAKYSLMITWVLGLYFLMLQWFEYSMATFSISDSIYGSSFYMATGFHGFHVIVGTLFLMIMWMRMLKYHFSGSHHFGFEAAAWYWHFVDVVWLFLFSVIYWWGTLLYNMKVYLISNQKVMNMFIMMFLESFILVMIVYMLFYSISYKMEMDSENISSYECGFDPKSITRLMFSYRFFLITILFLIFDVEISLMLPIPYMLSSVQSEILFFCFMMIIVLGLFYEYYYGSLNWLN